MFTLKLCKLLLKVLLEITIKTDAATLALHPKCLGLLLTQGSTVKIKCKACYF